LGVTRDGTPDIGAYEYVASGDLGTGAQMIFISDSRNGTPREAWYRNDDKWYVRRPRQVGPLRNWNSSP